MYKLNLVIALHIIFSLIEGTGYSNEPIESRIIMLNHIFQNNGIEDSRIVEFQIPQNLGYNEARVYCSLHPENFSSHSLKERVNIKKILKVFSHDRKTIVFESDFPLLGGVSFPIIQSGLTVEIWSRELPEGTWTSDVGINYYKDTIFADSINSEKLLYFQKRYFASYDHEMREKYLYGAWRDLPSTSALSLQIVFDGGANLQSLLSENADIIFMDGDELNKMQSSEYAKNLFKTQFVYLTRLNFLSDSVIKIYDNYGIIERKVELNGMDPLGGICNREGKFAFQLEVQIIDGRLKCTRIEIQRI